MDDRRFDALSRSLAARRSRRSAVRALGAGGLAAGVLATLGVGRALAADRACTLEISVVVSAGPNAGTTYAGTLSLEIGQDGAIDGGSFDTDDGGSFDVVGQATGRALNLRVDMGGDGVLTLTGTAKLDMLLCRGAVAGTFGGPDDGDIGTWRTVARQGNGNSGSSSGGTSSSGTGSSSGGSSSGDDSGGGNSSGSDSGGGSSSGGNSGSSSGSGGGGDCPSGVVCNGICCQARAGYTPDAMSCDSGFCACTYSCQAAGCEFGGTDHSFTVGCDDRPDALCGENCNFNPDTGCGDITCPDGQTLDLDSCTCM